MKLRHSPSDLCMEYTLRGMKAVQLSKCCCVFTPRQGTLIIAVVELALMSLILYVVCLEAMNTQEIASTVSAELEDLQRYWSSKLYDKFYISKYQRRMLSGQHVAELMITLAYVGVVISAIHILASILLLYGTLKKSASFLVPWLSTVLLSIVIFTLSMISFLFLQEGPGEYIFSGLAWYVIILGIQVYAWLIVFSHYREITSKKFNLEVENIVSPHYVIKTDCGNLRTDI